MLASNTALLTRFFIFFEDLSMAVSVCYRCKLLFARAQSPDGQAPVWIYQGHKMNQERYLLSVDQTVSLRVHTQQHILVEKL